MTLAQQLLFIAGGVALGVGIDSAFRMDHDLGPYAALMPLTHNRPIIALVVISDTEAGYADCLSYDINDPSGALHNVDFCQHAPWSKP